MTALGSGSNTFHAILLGLMSHFDQGLDIAPSSVYEWGYLYNDEYTKYFFDSYAQRILLDPSPVKLATKAYDNAGLLYTLEVLRNFPADIAARFFAATLGIVQIGAPERFLLLYSALPALVGVCILCISAISFRMALFSFFILLYLCGYPSLLFAERHYFHLQFVSLFFVGVLAQILISQSYANYLRYKISGAFIGNYEFKNLFLRRSFRAAAGIGLAFLIIAGCLPLLRLFQQAHVENLLSAYAQLLPASHEFRTTPRDESVVRLQPSDPISPTHATDRARTDYWILELDGARCGRRSVPIAIQYEFTDAYYDFSRPVVLELDSHVRYMFHTYSSARSFFSGVDIDSDDIGCVKTFSRAVDYEKMPLLMNLTFHRDWKNQHLYQTIGRTPQNNLAAKKVGVTLYRFPDTLAVGADWVKESLQQAGISPGDIKMFGDTVAVSNDAVIFKGNAPGPYAYALQLPLEKSKGDRYLVAEGELFSGGLTLGLLKNNQWAGQSNITTPGKFRLVMKPEAGDYTVTLAHNVPDQPFNHFKITRLGWTPEVK